VRLTPDEYDELGEAAAVFDLTRSQFVREAIAETLGDFREERIFARRLRDVPVPTERRSGVDRRKPAVSYGQNGKPAAPLSDVATNDSKEPLK
jgi:hypothetical protein